MGGGWGKLRVEGGVRTEGGRVGMVSKGGRVGYGLRVVGWVQMIESKKGR